jgi:hypothetical protein
MSGYNSIIGNQAKDYRPTSQYDATVFGLSVSRRMVWCKSPRGDLRTM